MTGAELAARFADLFANKDAPDADQRVVALISETIVEFWDRQTRIEECLEQLAFYAQNAEERARR
jgi:hypothetical protein